MGSREPVEVGAPPCGRPIWARLRHAKARIPTDEELRRITTRAVAEIVPQREFVDGLLSGRRRRLKMGFAPTKPVSHLCWGVGPR